MKRKKTNYDLRNSFIKSLNFVLFLLAVLNVFIVFRFERDRKPKIERVYETITTNHVIVVTNYISSSSSSLSPSPSVNTNLINDIMAKDRQVSVPYQFSMWGGRLYIRLYGQDLTVGSPTSYGRIERIFPERTLLDSGIWLVNTTPEPKISRYRNSLVNDRVIMPTVRDND